MTRPSGSGGSDPTRKSRLMKIEDAYQRLVDLYRQQQKFQASIDRDNFLKKKNFFTTRGECQTRKGHDD